MCASVLRPCGFAPSSSNGTSRLKATRSVAIESSVVELAETADSGGTDLPEDMWLWYLGQGSPRWICRTARTESRADQVLSHPLKAFD